MEVEGVIPGVEAGVGFAFLMTESVGFGIFPF